MSRPHIVALAAVTHGDVKQIVRTKREHAAVVVHLRPIDPHDLTTGHRIDDIRIGGIDRPFKITTFW